MRRWVFKQVRGFLFLFLVCAGVFPVVVTFVSMILFPKERSGSLVARDGTLVGSALIGQPFQSAKYFWGRPSLASQLIGPSQASHLSLTDLRLRRAHEERAEQWRSQHGGSEPPPEMLAASASGFDPHVSPSAAVLQVERVMKARGLHETQPLVQLIEDLVEPPAFGIFGAYRLNVLKLNLALDEKFPIKNKE